MDDRKAPRGTSCHNGPARTREETGPATQSIELNGLLGNHVTDSGSVDLRGVTPLSIQKLLDAVPIPVLVIDEPLRIVFANKACRKIGPDPKGMLSTPFRTLFPDPAEWPDIEAMLHEVFATRSPRIWQSLMGVGNCTVWGRMHVRSIRGPNGRSLLVLVEDLTLEKEQLRQNQRHQTILQDANRQLTAEIARRKEVEEALRESESRFRILVESAPFGLSVMAADGNFEFFNHKFTEIFGYTGDDLPNKLAWFHKAYPDPGYRETVFSIWKGDTSEAAVAGEVKPRVFTVRCKNGTDKIINFRAVNLHDQRQILTYEDITHQANIARALRESETKYRTLFETAGEAIFLMDGERFIECNTQALEMYGCTRDQIIGQTPLRFSPERQADQRLSRDKALEYINAALEGKPQLFEWQHSRYDGSLFDAEVGLNQLDLSGKKLVLAVARDITPRKQSEEALRKSEERYRQLVERANDIIFASDAGGYLTLVNPVAETITGYSQQELIGRHYLEIVHPDYRDQARRFYGRQFVKRMPDTYHELPILTKEARTTWLGEKVQLLTDGDTVLGFQAICRDITERKKAEELQIQTARLQAVADLASGVAHNFNNLLQIVMGAAQLASLNLDRGNDSNVRKQLEHILESCRFGAETVKRLQSFANIRSDEGSTGNDVFDLAALVREAAEMTKPWWKTAPEREGISVGLHLDLVDGCWIKGKPNELFEVVVNLIKNAAEALPEGGDIDVTTSVVSGQVVLTVRDTGVGLDPESAARVFDPFWTTKGLNGTGMGLAASYGIISRHSGKISVQGAEGQGSTFSVTVPWAGESQGDIGRHPEGSDLRLRILVIDDAESTVNILKEGLEHHGQTVFTALSGYEGLEVFGREPVDVVICDLGMPELSGWQVGRAVRHISQETGRGTTPFILLTGWGDQFDGGKISESGVDAVIQKPIDFDGLMQVIRDVLEKSLVQKP